MPVDFSVTLTRGTSRILGLVSRTILLCAIVESSAALAADVDITPKYSQSFEVDSNPLLAPSGGKTLYGSVFMPEVTFSRSTGDSNISMDNRLDLSRYNLDQFSSADAHSTIAGKKSWQTSYFSMSGTVDYDTTRTSEFNNSGINVAGIRHTGYSIAPEYGISLDPRDQFVLDANASYAHYDSASYYQDYVSYGLSPTLERAFDAKDTGELILQTSHYNTASGPRNTANTIGPAIGWKRQLTPALSINVSGGYQMVKINISGLESSTQYDYFYNVDVAYKAQRDSFDFTSSRGFQPQSSGRVTTATSFGFSGTHGFTRRTADTLLVNYEMKDYTTPFFGNESSFLEVSDKVSYQLAERWAIQPTLRYRREGRTGNFIPADSEAVLISFAFTPPDFNFH